MPRVGIRRVCAGLGSRRVEPMNEPTVLFAIFQTGSKANGGVESITQVIEGLRGLRKVVLTQAETPVNRRWRAAGAEVIVWDLPGSGWGDKKPSRLGRLLGYARSNLKAWRLIGAKGVDVVHCNYALPFAHIGYGAHWRGRPLVLNFRDTKADDEPLPIKRYRSWFRKSAVVLVLSQEMAAYYRRVIPKQADGQDESGYAEVRHIYSIVELDRMLPATEQERSASRRSWGIDDRAIAVGYVATFNDKKNQLGFIEQAGPALKRSSLPIKVYCFGDFDVERNEYARRCLETRDRLGLGDTVLFKGYTPAMREVYHAMDMTVVPTRKEGMARCMIESMASGLPVVSFDVCSAREILEGHGCGVVVRQQDYAGLVDGVLRLAGDSELRRAYAQAGRAAAESLYLRDHVVGAYGRLYEGLT